MFEAQSCALPKQWRQVGLVDCPRCGYHDPFHRSYFDVEKDAADPDYVKEWDLEIYQALEENAWVEVDGSAHIELLPSGFMYHRTPPRRRKDGSWNKGSVERWKIPVLIARKGGRIQLDPRPLNKAGLKLGSRLAPKLTRWTKGG